MIVALIALSAAAAVGTIAWRRLAKAPEGKPIATKANPPAGAERSLSYVVEARRTHKSHPDGEPFIPTSDTVFKASDEVRLRVSVPQAGYLYVVNEGPERANKPPDFGPMYPNAGESSQVAANQTIQIPTPSADPDAEWFVFNKEDAGVEKIWLIWSERSVTEMEAIKRWNNPIDEGVIKDPAQIITTARYLKALAQTAAEAEKGEKSGMTKFRGRGEILAGVVKLEHR